MTQVNIILRPNLIKVLIASTLLPIIVLSVIVIVLIAIHHIVLLASNIIHPILVFSTIVPQVTALLIKLLLLMRTFPPRMFLALVPLLYRVHQSLTFLVKSKEEIGRTSQQSRRQCWRKCS